MYIYGISIGIPFKEIADLLMSDAGRMVSKILDDNVFSQDGKVSDIFRYFETFPNSKLIKFNTKKDPNGNILPSTPLAIIQNKFLKGDLIPKYEKDTQFGKKACTFQESIARFAEDSQYTLQEKLIHLEALRPDQNLYRNSYQIEMMNQLIDTMEDYVIQADLILFQDKTFLDNLKVLSDGAEEFKRLGRILSLNQGIKPTRDELIQQVSNFEKLIYDMVEEPKDSDLIDIIRFTQDKAYRQECINKYDEVKHTINILDVVSTVPHFFGYLTELAAAVQENSESFAFRTAKSNLVNLNEYIGNKSGSYELNIINGVYEYINDYLRQQWMGQKNIKITIPKGNTILDKSGNLISLDQDADIILGTDWGDASFRLFMEHKIIPDLIKGKLTPSGNIIPIVKQNTFIKSLVNDQFNKTTSKNSTVVYTLPINMSPRNQVEIALRDSYRAEYNKLSQYKYQYAVTNYDENGNAVEGVSEAISITDLFTYYTLITFRGKLGENSLMSILNDFQNTGILKEYHDFVAQFDKSNITLDLRNNEDILYYIAPFGNPYTSYTNYIWGTKYGIKKKVLMHRLSPKQLFEIFQDEVDTDSVVGNYQFYSSDVESYFTKGFIQRQDGTFENEFKNEGGVIKYKLTYDQRTRELTSLKVNDESIDIRLTNVMTKVDGQEVINTKLIESIIKSKLNPC